MFLDSLKRQQDSILSRYWKPPHKAKARCLLSEMTLCFLCHPEEISMFTCGVQENAKLPTSEQRTEKAYSLELRTTVRYRLAAPVVFSWIGPGGGRLQAEGLTRDINAKGAFILTLTFPPEGALVSVEIFLPSLREGGHPVSLITEGQVMRVEHTSSGSGRGGFAVVSQGFAIPELASEAQ